MMTVSTLNTLFAGCAVCAANSVEGGWYALAAIVFGLGASAASTAYSTVSCQRTVLIASSAWLNASMGSWFLGVGGRARSGGVEGRLALRAAAAAGRSTDQAGRIAAREATWGEVGGLGAVAGRKTDRLRVGPVTRMRSAPGRS